MSRTNPLHWPVGRWLFTLACIALVILLGEMLIGPPPAGAGSAPALDAQRGDLGLPRRPPAEAHGRQAAMIALGQKMFFDRRLAFNGAMSCAMCHLPEHAFTTNSARTSVGIEGKSLRRNAPSLLNVAWQKTLFHDGRESSLATQAWLPLLHADEMANPSIGVVLDRIANFDDYAAPFYAAFGSEKPTMEAVGAAIAAYEATLVAADSRFDRWRFAGRADALTAEEQAGFALFTGKARCGTCHLVGPKSALFTDHQFHNTGVAQRSMAEHASGSARSVRLAPGLTTILRNEDLQSFKQTEAPDLGRYEITLRPEDRHAFKTPSLRNVDLTAPYMHDGSFGSLAEIVEYYDRGGHRAEGQTTLLKPLGLSSAERSALVAFLRCLSSEALASPALSRPPPQAASAADPSPAAPRQEGMLR